LRRKDLLRVLESLMKLGVVDVNWTEQTFELRPALGESQLIELRARAAGIEDDAQQLLKLCAERPVSEALSEISREKALEGAGIVASDAGTVPSGPSPDHLALQRQTPGRSVPWDRLRAALNDPDEMTRLQAEVQSCFGQQSAEKFAESPSAEKNAETETPQDQGFGGSAENFPDAPIASLALSTKAKLAITAEKIAEALEFLRKVDRRGTLQGRFGADYEALCQAHPDYVLGRLRDAFDDHERRYGETQFKLSDPVGWMGRKAAAEGRMKWHARQVRH
jgi:hypothetical protein